MSKNSELYLYYKEEQAYLEAEKDHETQLLMQEYPFYKTEPKTSNKLILYKKQEQYLPQLNLNI